MFDIKKKVEALPIELFLNFAKFLAEILQHIQEIFITKLCTSKIYFLLL